MQVNLCVGALAPHISKQLEQYGLMVERAEIYEENLIAVTRLLLNGYIPESVANKSRNKIIKDVFKNMKKKEGL